MTPREIRAHFNAVRELQENPRLQGCGGLTQDIKEALERAYIQGVKDSVKDPSIREGGF